MNKVIFKSIEVMAVEWYIEVKLGQLWLAQKLILSLENQKGSNSNL